MCDPGVSWAARSIVFTAVDETSVQGLVREAEAAWNTHDIKRFAACFAEDADFVNVAGAWVRGRDEIGAKHAASHADRLRTARC